MEQDRSLGFIAYSFEFVLANKGPKDFIKNENGSKRITTGIPTEGIRRPQYVYY